MRPSVVVVVFVSRSVLKVQSSERQTDESGMEKTSLISSLQE
jgi:hypothetical protein